ncbi:MAG: hypothetical protein ACRC0X_02340 [Brevinema sp.]
MVRLEDIMEMEFSLSGRFIREIKVGNLLLVEFLGDNKIVYDLLIPIGNTFLVLAYRGIRRHCRVMVRSYTLANKTRYQLLWIFEDRKHLRRDQNIIDRK